MSDYKVGKDVKKPDTIESISRKIDILTIVMAICTIILIMLLTYHFIESLPPTIAELNCEIKTPICEDGVLLSEYKHLKRTL